MPIALRSHLAMCRQFAVLAERPATHQGYLCSIKARDQWEPIMDPCQPGF